MTEINKLATGQISIHALLAESDPVLVLVCAPSVISIHALLAESDNKRCKAQVRNLLFLSTLSLRRATVSPDTSSTQCKLFLSTLSLRRATPSEFKPPVQAHNFYPRSPCGERPDGLFFFGRRNRISIHALLAESDVTVLGIQHKVGISIHALLAESDNSETQADPEKSISIHALLAESDWDLTGGLSCDDNFYPRSPCGERLLQS